MLVLRYTIKVFDEVLIGLQSKGPMICVVRRSLYKLLRHTLRRFVKPSAMLGKTVDKVQYKLATVSSMHLVKLYSKTKYAMLTYGET